MVVKGSGDGTGRGNSVSSTVTPVSRKVGSLEESVSSDFEERDRTGIMSLGGSCPEIKETWTLPDSLSPGSVAL